MRLLHTKLWRRVLEPLDALIQERGLDVELVPLGDGEGDALLAGDVLTEDEFRLVEKAGIRWVQVLTVGLEDVLTPALIDSDVVLTSVSGLSADDMADFALARILEHAKKLPELAERQRAREWKATWVDSVRGATLTVVGLGPIGTGVAALGVAHGMHVIGVRRHPDAGPGPCHEVVPPSELPTVLPRTDHLVMASPLTPETRGMIGRQELRALPDGALVVNVGRGGLIDEQALADVLREGRIAAALDVVATEPLPDDSPLWEVPGLAISPHCSAMTPAMFGQMVSIVAENLERHLRGERLRNIVDKTTGYPAPG